VIARTRAGGGQIMTAYMKGYVRAAILSFTNKTLINDDSNFVFVFVILVKIVHCR
jgi:hypothetical protein